MPSASIQEITVNEGGTTKKYQIPQGLKKILEEISREVLRKQPDNSIIYEFIADFLERKLRNEVDGGVYSTADGKTVTVTPSGTLVYSDGTPVPPGTKLNSSTGQPVIVSSAGAPVPQASIHDHVDKVLSKALDLVDVLETLDNGVLALDTAIQNKLQLYTTDGQPIRYTASGQILNSKGEILPPGTKLVTKDGKEFRKNTRGSVDDVSGLPVFLTEDGRLVTMKEDGTLVDSNGKAIPPGTKIFTPKGEQIAVNSAGRPVPVSKDLDRYATKIQAAFRGHLARKGGRNSKDGKLPEKLFDQNGKEVVITPSGHILDANGKPMPPGTRLRTASNKEITISPNGTILPSGTAGTKLFTEDGRPVKTTASGTYVLEDGSPLPPGTKVVEKKVDGPLKLDTAMQNKLQLYTTDGQPIRYTSSGQILNSKGEILPPGTKLVTKDGKEFRKNTRGSVDDVSGLPVFLTEDGRLVTMKEDGTLVDSNGKAIPPGTKLFTPKGEQISVNSAGRPVPVSKDLDRYATKIQAAFRGHLSRKNSRSKDGTKGGKTQAKLYDENGKEVVVTSSGHILDANGKLLPPGTKLRTASNKELAISPNGTIFPSRRSATKLFTEDGRPVKTTASGQYVLEDGSPLPPGTKVVKRGSSGQPDSEWLTNYWSTHDMPTRRSVPGDSTLSEMADALNYVLSEEDSMGPIEAFIAMIQRAIESLMSKLSNTEPGGDGPTGEGDQAQIGIPAQFGNETGSTDSATIVLDTAMQKKLQLYTEDGHPIKYTPSGQIMNSKGQLLPPGTKLVTKDGREFRRNTRGSVYDLSGKPVFLTQDGRLVVVGDDGTLKDADGKTIPPGTQLFTPKGEQIFVNPHGRPVPLSNDADRYATVIQAAYRGHLVRKGGRLSKEEDKKASGKAEEQAGSSKKLYDEDGREVIVTPSGHILDAYGKLLPPGTKLRTASNKELAISPNGTIYPSRRSISKIYTSDGRPVKATDSGHYVLEDGSPLPPGTKVKISGSRDMIVSPHGGLEEDRPQVPQERRRSGRMFTEDGLEIEASPSGRVLTLSGNVAPEDTKIKTIDLRKIISGEGSFPETNLFTESGIPVVVTSSGRVFTVEGRELFPGEILRTSDNRIMTVSPSGGIVLRPTTSVPVTSSLEQTPSGRKVEATQSGGALTPSGRALNSTASSTSRPQSSGSSKGLTRKMYTEDGEEVWMDANGMIVTKDGVEIPASMFVSTASGKLVDRTASGRAELPAGGARAPGGESGGPGSGGTGVRADDDILSQPASVVAEMARRNTDEGWLSEEQADPEGTMVEWASTVDEFMTGQISTIEGLLNGNIPLSQARGTIVFLTVSFVVGLVIGYGIARSLGLIGPPRNAHANVRTSLGNLHEIGGVIGPDGRELRHGVDAGVGRCVNK